MSESILGSGMKFPPQVDSGTGRFLVVSEAENVKESIYLILMTQRSERFLRPEFGSNLMSYAFMDINATNIALLTTSLSDVITAQEPRVRNVSVTTDGSVQGGCLMINIDYTIINENTRDNLVFPFYIETPEEEEPYEPGQFVETVE